MFLSACGDSGTTENVYNQTGLDIITSIEDLPTCGKDNDGEQVFVKNESGIRVCTDGKWYATVDKGLADTVQISNSDTVYVAGTSCMTEPLSDSSGVKILCGGDSVGIILNGTDGKNGAQGVGCSVETLADNSGLKVLCGGDSVGVLLNGNDDAADEDGSDSNIVILDSEKVAVSLDTVHGASQKGPFLSGSKVLIKELLDGRSLTQTGNNFDGKILNDRGEFRVTARMLVSQYVMLEANGYYRNEVTGTNSSSPLTLFGITDVTAREVVNINLLTHLEYERVYNLVTSGKYTVKMAKKIAQKEILDIMHVDNTGFSNSEDLSIAGSSDEDGALLAFSILFQGDRSVSELSELLTKVSTDMEQDGKWDDAATKLSIADWAMAADTSGRLATIRSNVAGWELSSMVANFEPYIRNFWREEYGLGKCGGTGDSSVVEGTVAEAKYGVTSGTNVRFICAKESSGEYLWRTATDYEKDTYGWADSTDGALKIGNITGKTYVFDENGSYNGREGWRLAVIPEEKFGGCREELYGNIVTYRGDTGAGFYQCVETSHKWVKILNTLAIDTQMWEPQQDGYAAWGDSIGVIAQVGTDINWTKVCYVYDESLTPAAYRIGDSTDCSLGIMGCTKKRAGKYETLSNGKDYVCVSERWNLTTDPVLRNTHDLACKADSNNAAMIQGTEDDMYFVCADNQWETASASDEIRCRNDGFCTACIASNEGKFAAYDGKVYGCVSKAWIATTFPESVIDARCVEENIDSMIFDLDTLEVNSGTPNTVDWICSATGWHRANWWNYSIDSWHKEMELMFGTDTASDYFQDARDGNWYRKVTIGSQVWMAENLRYADSISTINLKGQTICYNNEEKNCEIAGLYYTWTAAVDLNSQWKNASASALIKAPHRGICPEGWHIPTISEWKTLGKNADYSALQMTGFFNWTSATNSSGFSTLPAGLYYNGFSGLGAYAYFWATDEDDSSHVYNWWVGAKTSTYYNYAGKYRKYSIRCLQDSE